MRTPSRRQEDQSTTVAELLACADNDKDLLRELLTIFREEFPMHMNALREAVQGGDCRKAMMVSHTLKGMLSTLSIMKHAGTVAELEALARSNEQEKLRNALAEFEQETVSLLPELERHFVEIDS